MRTALIDADSILYVIGWHSRELSVDEASKAVVESNVDNYVRAMLQKVDATDYLGVFSDTQCFRNRCYLYAPYKGGRPVKPDFMVKWEATLKEYLSEVWGFVTAHDLEADDIVAALQVTMPIGNSISYNPIVLSPDKDLRQNPGNFFDYKKNGELEWLSTMQARKNLYISLISGDTTDNIKGVPGLGPDKAAKLFARCETDIEHEMVLIETYQKYFGEYYGPIILQQTKDAITMLSPRHRWWIDYKDQILSMKGLLREVPKFDADFTKALSEIGW
jgi:5'-3' exonuclease